MEKDKKEEILSIIMGVRPKDNYEEGEKVVALPDLRPYRVKNKTTEGRYVLAPVVIDENRKEDSWLTIDGVEIRNYEQAFDTVASHFVTVKP